MTLVLLIITHIAAVGIGAVLSHLLTVRYLTAREVDGTPMVGFSHAEPKEGSVNTGLVALIASFVVLVIGAGAYQAQRNFTGDIKDLQDSLQKAQCGQSVLFLSLLTQPPDPDEPKPTAEDKAVVAKFLAEYTAQYNNLHCAEIGYGLPDQG